MKWIKWIFSIVLLIIILFGINYFINKINQKEIFEYIKKDIKADFPNKFKQYDMQKCSFWFWNKEYAFIGNYNDNFDSKKIFFYKIKKENGKISDDYIGATDIGNTTFENLLSMVKQDCYQFQKSNNWWNKESEEIMWNWSKAESQEKIKEREEREKEEERKFQEKLKKSGLTLEEYIKKYGPSEEDLREQEKVLKEYGF